MIVKTPHIEADEHVFGETVLMPGDPLRSKYIADTFFDNKVLINNIRGVQGYTGIYKGHKVSVMASGMGMPSMGIYSYELYKLFNVKNIIRVGSCGSLNKNIKVGDIIIADKAYTESNIAYSYAEEDVHMVNASIIDSTNYTHGTIMTSDVFDHYTENNKLHERIKDKGLLGVEMETFMLYYMANKLNKKALSILTVSDSIYEDVKLTALERQASMNKAIVLALDLAIEVGKDNE